jgi:hypothetical protein
MVAVEDRVTEGDQKKLTRATNLKVSLWPSLKYCTMVENV